MTMQATIETDSLYERDFHAWLTVQAALLRQGDLAALDLPNLLEEIETLGKSETQQMRSRLTVILEHLLKYQFGLNRDPERGWRRTLVTQRDDLGKLLKASPSLRARLTGALAEDYASARKRALAAFDEYEPHNLALYRETLPSACPYTLEQILDEDWLPEPLT